ncbi:uncharacterized protein SPPG_00751 [Spizellomyces punctatus DAOM BR117]|uniref:Galactose oxidase-like Early set domain-containing protein n=1 Tax=Spizellomyces punctatus (strain DAOM BR117) TaxID=645134 RepID=A0A0L0HUR5_SPIPD|nr:uncharacterized protein SPPG_00751 [Spizellomyces punctatus DAOM BR117]KND05076.1 hypothetical protein SPPG_00751 [Spizellomyces punctatus DAOM BR117]|eukprot:XP_016613115.1 hypothetical protein SPPG_00751 [Spizellomyces punctatus DAOM BR117]
MAFQAYMRWSLLVAFSCGFLANAQDSRATLGEFEVISENSGVVAVHLALLPEEKVFLSERFHELPTAWKPFINETTGLKPNEYWNRDQALADWAANASYWKPNKNCVAAGFLTDVAEFDIKSNKFELKKYPFDGDQGYSFCNGIAQMADGTLLVAGGDAKFEAPLGPNGERITTDGRRDVRIYKDGVLTKVPTAQMPYMEGPGQWKNYSGRWYPTVITLANEDVMILGGQKIYYEPGNPIADNPTYETYRTATRTLDPPVRVEILAKTFPVNMYPIAYVLPSSGNVFTLAGNMSAILDPVAKTEQHLVDLPKDGIMHRSFPFSGTNWLNPLTPANNYKPTVWICGGTNMTTTQQDLARDGKVSPWWDNCSQCLATSRCYSIEPEAANAQWVPEEMPIARSQPMAINLPDGTIAIFGGSGKGHQGGDAGICLASAPTNKVVLFNPGETDSSERWKIGAEAQVPRLYHASSVLRTDGSVLLAGSDNQNFANIRSDPYELRLEVYRPPYFFIPNRPALNLAAAPKTLRYGQQFIVPLTSDVGATIRNVSIIRYGSSTHTLNVDQRHVELKILQWGKGKLLVQSPPGAKVAPPGNWMLWAVDNRGAPVVQSATINLRANNTGENAVWSDSDSIQPDPLPKKSKNSNAGVNIKYSSANALGIAVAGSILLGLL